ncbi:MAG: glycosyltransferase, partial [Alphaproteobacteria bacterium]
MTAYTWGAQVESGPEVPESGSSLRILICSNAYPPHFMGGAELMAHEQALALSRLGHDVRVFAADPLFAGHSAEQGIRHARTDNIYQGIRVYRIATEPEDYSPEFVNFQNSVAEGHFRDVLREFEPQIVHCHNLLGLSVKLPLMARMYGARTVCTLHDFWGFCLRNTAVRADGRACDNSTCCNECLARIHDGRRRHVPMRLRKDFIRLALEQVDRFIAPSHFVAGRYAWSGLSADRLEVIPNGIDIDRFRAKRNTSESSLAPVKVTYVGYLGAHKGVITLVEALALPPLEDFRVILQLVGEGPEREACVARVNALGLQDRVHFLGKVQPAGMASIYAGSDIVVLPSIWDENQPVCLMEAMAAGLPVIASRKGGIPELIDDGVNGLMFRAGDPGD